MCTGRVGDEVLHGEEERGEREHDLDAVERVEDVAAHVQTHHARDQFGPELDPGLEERDACHRHHPPPTANHFTSVLGHTTSS